MKRLHFREAVWCCTFHGILGLHTLKSYLVVASPKGVFINFPVSAEVPVRREDGRWRVSVDATEATLGDFQCRVRLDALDGQRDARYLDLGTVKNLARVRLNGRELGVAWCAPFRVAVPAGLLREAANELEITVVNTWVNRLIGDEQEPEDCELEPGNPDGDRKGSYDIRVPSRGLKDLPDWFVEHKPRPSPGRLTFTSWRFYDHAAPLQPAGLLGPVTWQH
ncbi:MAG: hypothetical protein FJ276_03675 [Planctomycetes bacterium]|nr:hypothetical protein [Planctomycetota bacterium]